MKPLVSQNTTDGALHQQPVYGVVGSTCFNCTQTICKLGEAKRFEHLTPGGPTTHEPINKKILHTELSPAASVMLNKSDSNSSGHAAYTHIDWSSLGRTQSTHESAHQKKMGRPQHSTQQKLQLSPRPMHFSTSSIACVHPTVCIRNACGAV